MGQTPRLLVFCALIVAGCTANAGTRQKENEPARRFDGTRAPPTPADPFAFDPALFEKKHKPGPSDWIAAHPEPSQSFAQYMAQAPKGLTSKRNIIVLQPIGRFGPDEQAALDKVREFASAFFQLRVRVEPPIPLPHHGKRARTSGDMRWTQYHTKTLMGDVLLPRLPADAVCYLGVTMADLYPDPSWNFVFGEATLSNRVGVYSLVRYTNRFWGTPETERSRSLALLRAFKLMAHETGHMFSLHHCTVNECLMNGSNSLDETDRNTIHLCPVCLHKLQWNLKFDVTRHYRQLQDIYRRNGYEDEAEWTTRRLASLQAPP
jgi:archaemetzincin